MPTSRSQANKDYKALLMSSKDARTDLAEALFDHLELGLSIRSFGLVSNSFLKQLFELFPDDFCKDSIEISCDKGCDMWEKMGKDQAAGKNMGNSRTWFYNMSHRYGWTDKVDIHAKVDGALNVSIVNYSKDV